MQNSLGEIEVRRPAAAPTYMVVGWSLLINPSWLNSQNLHHWSWLRLWKRLNERASLITPGKLLIARLALAPHSIQRLRLKIFETIACSVTRPYAIRWIALCPCVVWVEEEPQVNLSSNAVSYRALTETVTDHLHKCWHKTHEKYFAGNFLRKVEGRICYTSWLKRKIRTWQYNGMDISSEEKTRVSSRNIVKFADIEFKVVMLAITNLSLPPVSAESKHIW